MALASMAASLSSIPEALVSPRPAAEVDQQDAPPTALQKVQRKTVTAAAFGRMGGGANKGAGDDDSNSTGSATASATGSRRSGGKKKT